MRTLELKIPPPAVSLLCAGAMWLLATYAPGATVPVPWRAAVAGVLVVAGGLAALAGALAFRRFETTVNPMRPERSTALVTTGIYRFTRNPMYVGLLLVLTAWAAWLSNLLAVLLLPVFVGYLNRFQIRPEERALTATFGEAFAAYCRRVRRWI